MRAKPFPSLADQVPAEATFTKKEAVVEGAPVEDTYETTAQESIQAAPATEEKANEVVKEEETLDVNAIRNPLYGKKRPARKWAKVAEIPKEQIEAWKKEHGPIYKTAFANEEFIITRVPRKIYKEAMNLTIADKTEESIKNETMEERNERIYKRQEFFAKNVILWPEDFEFLLAENAGYAPSISDEAILRSGFEIPDTEEL